MLEEIRAAGIKVSGMAYSAAIKVCTNHSVYTYMHTCVVCFQRALLWLVQQWRSRSG